MAQTCILPDDRSSSHSGRASNFCFEAFPSLPLEDIGTMSILLPLARRPLNSTLSRRILCQNNSSQASSGDVSEFSLPPAKLRALISIYHQSAHFITPQNLSDAIDRAFIGDASNTAVDLSVEASSEDIKEKLKSRRIVPATGPWSTNETHFKMSDTSSQIWASRRSEKEQKVMNVLYGTDKEGKPGLEILEEERSRLLKNMEEDKRNKL